jgi:hypothetical protein
MDEPVTTVETQFQISKGKEQTARRRHPPDQFVTRERVFGAESFWIRG